MLLRSTLLYAPAVLFTRVASLLLLVVATRLLDQNEYGLLALVVTIGEMTDIAVTNWLRIVFIRLGGKGAVSHGSLRRAARVLALTTLLALALSVAAALLVVPERWQEFALAVGAYLVAGSIGRFALVILQMQQRHAAYALLEFLRAAFGILLPVAAILLLQPTFLVASLAGSAAVLLAGSVGLLVALARTVPGPSRFGYAEFFLLGMPLVLVALLSLGINSAERLLLKVFHDAGAVAVYAAAYALARQPIDVIANAINIGAFPELASRFDEHGPGAAAGFLREQMALMARLCLPVAALLIVLAPEITALLLPTDYHAEVVLLFPVIVLGVIFANLQSFVYENVFHAHKRNWHLIWVALPGAVAGIGFGLLLVPPLGSLGAALALTAACLVNLASAVLLSARLMPVPPPWRDLALSLGLALLCALAASAVVQVLAGAWLVLRLACALAAAGIVFLAAVSAMHPQQARRFVAAARARLGRPSATAQP